MKRNYGLFFGFAALLIAAIFTFAACADDDPSKPNVSAPPETVTDGAAVKAYVESIWGDLPADWQQGFLGLMSLMGGDFSAPPPAKLSDVPDTMWNAMSTDWEGTKGMLGMVINDYINAGKSFEDFEKDMGFGEDEDDPGKGPSTGSKVGLPPATVVNGAAAKAYFENIWGDLPADWQQGFLGILSEGESSKPTKLSDVNEDRWAEMSANWSLFKSRIMEPAIGYINAKKSFEDFKKDMDFGGDDNPNIPAPPATVASGEDIKAYFEDIWDNLPGEWQSFFLKELSRESPAQKLDDVKQTVWNVMSEGWGKSRDVFTMLINDYISKGKSPLDYEADKS